MLPSGPSPVRKVGPNRYLMTTTTKSPLKTARLMLVMRALWKTVIEFIYLKDGPAAAFNPVFDPARREVSGDGDGYGWVVIPKRVEPHGRVRARYEARLIDGRFACPMEVDVFGQRFYSDPVRRFLTRDYLVREVPWPASIWVFPKEGAAPQNSANEAVPS